MDAMFGGAIGGKKTSCSLELHPTSSTTMPEWPRREACANLPDQIKSTAEQGQMLLVTITEAPKSGSMLQMNQDSIVNFVKNVICMCEMIPKPDPAVLQDRSERHGEPARYSEPASHSEPAGAISSDQGTVVKALKEIKKLKMEMDAQVAAVEAAIRTQNQPTALTLANGPGQDTDWTSETLQKTTRNFAPVPTFGEIGQLERTRMLPEDIVQTNDAVVNQGAQGSAHPIGDQPTSGCDVNVSRSSIDQTAAASAVSGEASQTTQKPIHVSNKMISRNQSSSCSSGQADGESDSCSEGSSSNDGTDVEGSDDESREEESDDETGEEDSDESSSGDDEDTEMEDTETSE
ncbi:MAG: hypothetical protein Q9198_005629 [Flavoplaca austrocitrina]